MNREQRCFVVALDALEGVGDASLGEWREVGDIAVHLRRRLSPLEAASANVDVADIRGTDEFKTRIDAMQPWLHPRLRGRPLESYP